MHRISKTTGAVGLAACLAGTASGGACPWDCEPSPDGAVGVTDLLAGVGPGIDWSGDGDATASWRGS